jgi:hypothetical protein
LSRPSGVRRQRFQDEVRRKPIGAKSLMSIGSSPLAALHVVLLIQRRRTVPVFPMW